MPALRNLLVRFALLVRVPRACAVSLVFALCWLASNSALAGTAAIASAHPMATAAGKEVLDKGGNAFDAAVAVAAALAVVEPYSSGLGGGAFFLLRRAHDGFQVMVDARETAPARASRDMYLDAAGKPQSKLSVEGALAAGIPGEPAGLAWVSQRFGRVSLKVALAPAIRLAREGFAVDARYAGAATFRESMLRARPDVARTFLDQGNAPKPGYVVRQPELAATLEALAERGREGFYAGEVARRMVEGVTASGGIWSVQDLADYRVVEREPTRIGYHGAAITTATLPSSGGVVLAEALQILEGVLRPDRSAVERDHLIAEAMRRGYQDRARYLGDPAFVRVPPVLTTRAYALERGASIDPDKATPSANLDVLYPPLTEGTNTTHFSVADEDGNLVAATLSINLPFGAGVLAGNTGVLLNNEMDDFSAAPGVGNAYGLVGDAANAIAPGKRPLSSMTPTFVDSPRGTLVFGTPGGARIISMVLLGIVGFVDDPAMDIDALVGAPRFHQQYLPDRIEYEPGGFSMEWVSGLQAKGHVLQEGRRRWGNMQAVFVDAKTKAASAHNDPRGKAGLLF